MGNYSFQAMSGNYWIGSQFQFVEDKSDGLGLDYMPTRVWVKQSASVAFRRPMSNPEIPGSVQLKEGGSYKVMMQYGLFNNADDDNKSKVKGAVEWNQAIEIKLPA